MDLKGDAASLTVQEAMKILNMKKFTAKELNSKFQYRVQSITRGLGGTLENQKSIYTAWEYLNRMLARETSNQTEEVLKKVDQTVKMLEKPKQLDVIPVRLNDMSKKASLIIQKDIGKYGEPKSRKPKVQTSILKSKAGKLTQDEKRQDPEKSLGISALPGQLYQKHIKWMDKKPLIQQNKDEAGNKEVPRTEDRKGFSVRINRVAQKRPEKDPTMQQLREIIRIDRNEKQEERKAEKQEELNKVFEKLPKLPRTQSGALLFKRTTALNGMFENPRKASRYDQWTSTKKAAWKEGANRLLSDRPDSVKRPKSVAKSRSRKARRSVSKQPVEQKLYKIADPARTIRSQKPNSEHLTNENPGPDNSNSLARGPFTTSRIMKWIKSAQTQDGGTVSNVLGLK